MKAELGQQIKKLHIGLAAKLESQRVKGEDLVIRNIERKIDAKQL